MASPALNDYLKQLSLAQERVDSLANNVNIILDADMSAAKDKAATAAAATAAATAAAEAAAAVAAAAVAAAEAAKTAEAVAADNFQDLLNLAGSISKKRGESPTKFESSDEKRFKRGMYELFCAFFCCFHCILLPLFFLIFAIASLCSCH